MSEKKLVEMPISKETEFELEFKDGKLRLILGYDGKGVDGGLFADLDPEYFLDKLADAIPGTIDNMVIEAIKGALK